MSGLVGAVCLRPGRKGTGETERARDAARSLAALYHDLRGGSYEEVAASQAGLCAFDCAVVGDARGWTAIQGAAHGDRLHPVSPADLRNLDGQFSMVSYDAGTGGLLLATDRFGAAPVYVAEQAGLLWFSTSAMVLARHLSSTASASALRGFLVGGSQFGAETYWDDVRRLEPGAFVEVVGDRVLDGSYWHAQVDPDVERLDLRQAVDLLLDISVATLEQRHAGQHTWLDLTGGYDSRLLALLLARAGVPFTGNTRQSAIGDDIDIAGGIAATRDWPWQAFRIPQEWPALLPGLADKALAAADGRLEVLELSRVVWVHEQLARDKPSLLSAGGGEHLQYYAWSSELPRPGRRQADLTAWVDRVAVRPADTTVLANGSSAATKSAYVDRLSAWVDRYRDQPSTRVLDACYAYKAGSGHFGAYRAADDLDLTAQLPFFYEPIFSAAFSVHHRHRGGFRLMREMMLRLDPEIARVATTRGGPAVPMRPSTAHRYLPYYGILGRKGANKISHKLTGRAWFPFPEHRPWPEQEANLALLEHLRDREVLRPNDLRIRPLLSHDGAERLIRGEVNAGMLGRLLTAEMTLAATGTGL